MSTEENQPAMIPESAPEDDQSTTPLSNSYDAEIAVDIGLSDIAHHCSNYTELGFSLYADKIKGALISGESKVAAIEEDASKTGLHSVYLTYSEFDTTLFLEVLEVPKEVALRLRKEDISAISGIITDSVVIGTNCEVTAVYQ